MGGGPRALPPQTLTETQILPQIPGGRGWGGVPRGSLQGLAGCDKALGAVPKALAVPKASRVPSPWLCHLHVGASRLSPGGVTRGVTRALRRHRAASGAIAGLGGPRGHRTCPQSPALVLPRGHSASKTGTGDSDVLKAGIVPSCPCPQNAARGWFLGLVAVPEQRAGGQRWRGDSGVPAGLLGTFRPQPGDIAVPQQGPASAAQGSGLRDVPKGHPGVAVITAILGQEGQGPPRPPRLWGQR